MNATKLSPALSTCASSSVLTPAVLISRARSEATAASLPACEMKTREAAPESGEIIRVSSRARPARRKSAKGSSELQARTQAGAGRERSAGLSAKKTVRRVYESKPVGAHVLRDAVHAQ